MKDLLSQGFEVIEKRYENKAAITGLPTGFTDFDRLTSGLQPGNLVIIAARPGLGKSTLVTNMATHVAVDLRRPVVMFSLEMSQMELLERVLAAQGRIDNDRLRTGRLRDDDWPKLSQAMGRLGEANFYIDDTAGINLMEIRSKCRRLKQRHGLDLIVIDYLQLMQSHRRVDNRVQEVSELSRGLKVLAKELDTPVIALSQLSRKPEDRSGDDRKPRLSDLRESGSIEQDADIVAFIYREEVYDRDSAHKGEAELIVAKHRGGALDSVPLSFIGHQSRFANMARGATTAM
jgi:replicative DNA helicase